MFLFFILYILYNMTSDIKAFKKDLKKLLMQVGRLDLQLKQEDIKAYWYDESIETKSITDCYDVLVALYPVKKVWERKYQTSSHF